LASRPCWSKGLFERLISVSGIGPKVALSILSGIEPAELMRAIRSSDVARLTRIPGVGKKTAERVVLELKDRLPQPAAAEPAAAPHPDDDVRADLLSALVNLGYHRANVEKTVDKVLHAAENRSFEALLRETLKLLIGR
jgi:Holliday junction DNA helicase RuvA